ncbi:MAG: 2-amino-4-hydroxy-6-hydroxymethyldihydropteridine diphosphokinase [Pseudomonadota bacterium]
MAKQFFTHQVFIGLGSNLNQPEKQVKAAIKTLKNQQYFKLVNQSPLYHSKPLANLDQPDYCNAVVKLQTDLTAEALLNTTQALEIDLGRQVKNTRWAARVIDLDILLFDKLIMTSERLTLPHPGLLHRDFVLKPLYDIEPDLTLPNGMSINDALAQLPAKHVY